MVILTEQDRTLEFMQSEANGYRSRGEQEFDSTTDWSGERILPGQVYAIVGGDAVAWDCLLYTSPSPRDRTRSRMPSSA